MDRDRNVVAMVAGVAILLNAAAARLVLAADEERVYVFGRAIPWECALRRAGLPCPTCGMTRSIVMSLHGELGRAWHIAPAGPVLAAGLLLVAAFLLLCPVRRTPWPRWMRTGAIAYAVSALLIWLGGWVSQFAAALHQG